MKRNMRSFNRQETLVSVIVPTKNSERTLESCIRSLQSQTYSKIEIIVVDAHSKDSTVEVASHLSASVHLLDSERCVARNFGAGQAAGECLFFVDADMIVEPDLMRQAVVEVEDGVDAVTVPEVTIGQGFWAEMRAVERLAYVGDPLFEACRFFSRSAFDRLGGYDEKLVAFEDYDIQARAEQSGLRIGRTQARILHDEGKVNLAAHLMKKRYYARCAPEYFRKHQTRALAQFLPLRRVMTLNSSILRRHPRYFFGVITLKALEFTMGALSLIA